MQRTLGKLWGHSFICYLFIYLSFIISLFIIYYSLSLQKALHIGIKRLCLARLCFMFLKLGVAGVYVITHAYTRLNSFTAWVIIVHNLLRN